MKSIRHYLVVATCASVVFVLAVRMTAAPPVQDIPKWDAVSVKRCTNPPVRGGEGARTGAGPGATAPSPGRITANCASLSALIVSAYVWWADGERDNVRMVTTKLEGFPDWTNSERYTIEAKAEGAPGEGMMNGPMMQKLLEDRFQVKVHEETREGRVYILSLAKGGPKMQTLPPGGCAPFDYAVHNPPPANRCPYTSERDGNMGFDAWMSMDSMVTLLTGGTRNPQSPLDAPIINKTGLTDVYHVRIEYTPLTPLSDAPPAASIFTAVQSLGLKLETGKGPQQVLVFDHAERPSEN